MSVLTRAAALRLLAVLLVLAVAVTVQRRSPPGSPALLAAAGPALLVFFVLVRQRLRRYWAQSRWDEWIRTAAGLAWRDRVGLFGATVRGRPVPDPRLAALAAQRAERLCALLDVSRPGRDVSWSLLGAAAALLPAVWLMLTRERVAWASFGWAALLVTVCLTSLLVNRRRARRARRCLRANRPPVPPR
ncbi:hypothetical protein [Streptomyces sp. NPDC019507]|uniref:hypothetical protein n=1 Tax=Streptomyces sp. NPDC019507 TaxID=3154689 RepID=UPI0033C7ABCB